MSATRFIVVRHCEAQGNIRRVFNGITDGDITENGARQLDLLAARMAGKRFDVIYSSPLRRSVLVTSSQAERSSPHTTRISRVSSARVSSDPMDFSSRTVVISRESNPCEAAHNPRAAAGEPVARVNAASSS